MQKKAVPSESAAEAERAATRNPDRKSRSKGKRRIAVAASCAALVAAVVIAACAAAPGSRSFESETAPPGAPVEDGLRSAPTQSRLEAGEALGAAYAEAGEPAARGADSDDAEASRGDQAARGPSQLPGEGASGCSPAPQKPAPSAAPEEPAVQEAAQPAHVCEWEQRYRHVHIDATYDNVDVLGSVCDYCNANVTGFEGAHLKEHAMNGIRTRIKGDQVVDTKRVLVAEAQDYEEPDGSVCKGCGAVKAD